ncbi:MAG: heavy metal translocating P-type ATPase [Aggregatilineales bacterium]
MQIGDILLIRPGERVAVDGEVLVGTAAVNQAAITGESLPVDKKAGDSVFAGTLVEGGALKVRTVKIGDETTLGQIRRMVAEAQKQKAPIERILDHYAKFYTPIALVLALVLWVLTKDPLRAITVLIVFCPCVMVLATPTALVASIGNAALRGSLVKKGATIDTIAFDKTRTLTSGKPRLVSVTSWNGLTDAELLRMAASAEKFSEHPPGQAIVRAATAQGMTIPDPQNFQALPGLGGWVDGCWHPDACDGRVAARTIIAACDRQFCPADRGQSATLNRSRQFSAKLSPMRSVCIGLDNRVSIARFRPARIGWMC